MPSKPDYMQERRKGQCGVQAGNSDPWEGEKGAYINKADKENGGCGREHPGRSHPFAPTIVSMREWCLFFLCPTGSVFPCLHL